MQHQTSITARTGHPRTGARPALAAALTAGLVGLATAAAGPALAEEDTEQAGPGTTQQPVAVVMDYSESMLKKDADEQGTARIDAAKEATKALIERTPEDAPLGMVAFGHADRKTCTKIETLQKVEKIDKKALTKKVDALDARGGTPIGKSLQQAADELQSIEGEKSIILVSDGEPTCDEPPACEVAQQLAEDGIDLTVHTIGFRLQGNAKAQETLECIADATGGTYTDAADADALTESLTTQTSRALQGYTTAGTPVQGGASPEDAPRMTAGQFTDTITTQQGREDDGEESTSRRYYRIPVHEGYTPVVSATVVKDRETEEMLGGSEVMIRPLDLSEEPYETCLFLQDTVTPLYSSGMHATIQWFPHKTFAEPMGDRPREDCLTEDGEVVVEVMHNADIASEDELPLELLVAYAKQETASGSPAPSPTVAKVKTGKAEPVAGGGSFNEAAPIESGQTITDSLVPGEARYFTVDAATNQTLAVRLEATSDPEDRLTLTGMAFNPLREHMDFYYNEDGGVDGGSNLSIIMAEAGEFASSVLDEHIHPNRRLSGGEHKAISVPGGQYIKVQRDYEASASDVPQAFELTVDVRGEADDEVGEFITTAVQYNDAFGEDQAEEDSEKQDDDGTSSSEADDASASPESSEGDADATNQEGEDADASAPTEPEASGKDEGEKPSSGTEDTTAADVQAAGTEDSGGLDGILPWALGGLGVIALAGGGIILARRRGA